LRPMLTGKSAIKVGVVCTCVFKCCNAMRSP
jgi:hypothetical protein